MATIECLPSQLVTELRVYSDESLGWDCAEPQGGCCPCEIDLSGLHTGLLLMLGMAAVAVAQDNGVQLPSARQQLQHIHTPQSIDQELARLTNDTRPVLL